MMNDKDKGLFWFGVKILAVAAFLLLLKVFKVDEIIIPFVEPVGIKAGRIVIGLVWLLTTYVVIGLIAIVGLFFIYVSKIKNEK